MLKFEMVEESGMQTTPWRCNIVEIFAAVAQQVIGRYSWVISHKLGYPFSRIITLLKSCSKLLLARLAIKGKSLKEVTAFHC